MKRIAVLAAMMGALLLIFGLSDRGALEARRARRGGRDDHRLLLRQ